MTSLSPTTRNYLMRKEGGQCHYCKCVMVKHSGRRNSLTLDHVIPKCAGGTRERKNIVGACWACNNARGNMSYEAFVAIVANTGQPHGSPGGGKPSPREWLVGRIQKEDLRAKERAIKAGNAPWTAKPSALRGYLEGVGKYPSLAEAFVSAGIATAPATEDA